MKLPLMKLAPSAIILLASGACAWPYLGSMHPQPQRATADAPKEIPSAILKPVLPPRPERDPFQDPELLRAEARVRLARAVQSFLSKHVVAKPTDRAIKEKAQAKAIAKANEKTKAAAGSQAELDPRRGLILNATSVHETGGVAVINGRSYKRGEQLLLSRTGDPCVLQEVRTREVVLRHHGRSLTLGFPTVGARQSSADPGRDAGAGDSLPTRGADGQTVAGADNSAPPATGAPTRALAAPKRPAPRRRVAPKN
jgi:hypothetical protein